tara:strand:+ start:651 stop:1019 length:369 start_codon:yes stop_codon:yes gene_type:complete
MPKRSREPEEEELEVVAKRVCQLDSMVVGNKRPAALEEYTPNKRQRHTAPTLQYKTHEYRACIRKLYHMNKRLLAKMELLKHEQRYTEEKYLALKNEVKMRGMEARYWHPGHSPPPMVPVVM